MGTNIITGYTGTRHITPAKDAAVFRSIFGPDNYILREGDDVDASMPDINSFVVSDGMVSIQGRQVQILQETLSIDTCPSAKKRIDLVAVRYAHDSGTQIDSASLVVIKGTEVDAANDPSVPTYNTGSLDEGATVVDFPLYRIDMAGSTVTFERVAPQSAVSVETVDLFKRFGWSETWTPTGEYDSDES